MQQVGMARINAFNSHEDLVKSGSGRCGNLFFLNGRDTGKVIVLFNGRVPANLLDQGPIFQRWTWAKSFRHPVIIASDPLVNADTGITLGWYAGGRNGIRFLQFWREIQSLILAARMQDAKIITFGSSGGGFASLMAAAHGLVDKALAVNPQTDIREYYHRISAPYLDKFWGTIETADEAHISVIRALSDSDRVSPIIYAQNKADKFHLDGHLGPLKEALKGKDLPLQILEYDDPEQGHSPPNLDGLCKVFGGHMAELLTEL